MVDGHVWNMFDEESKYKLFFEYETLSPTLQQWQCFLKISEIAGDWKVRYGRQELGSTTGVVGRDLDPKCMLDIYHFCLNRKCGLLHFLYPFVMSSLFLPQQEPERRQGFDPTCSTFFLVQSRSISSLCIAIQVLPDQDLKSFVFLHFEGRTGVVHLIVFLILKVRVQPFSSF